MSGDRTSNLIILTGAPGSGKTAILNRLRDEVRCIGEPAREVLAEQRAIGGTGTWEHDPSLFVHLLLQRSIEKYETARGSEEPVVFDLGIPDCVLYAVLAEADLRPSFAAVDSFRYCPRVLFLRPWEDIYATDEERVISFEETVSFSHSLTAVYERSGYHLVEVPRDSIAGRASYVRHFIERERQRPNDAQCESPEGPPGA